MVKVDPAHADFLRTFGVEIRALRERLGENQQFLADIFNWNRDAISKLELGEKNMSVYDYLRLMHFLRDFAPDHPAQALYDHFFPRAGRPPSHKSA